MTYRNRWIRAGRSGGVLDIFSDEGAVLREINTADAAISDDMNVLKLVVHKIKMCPRCRVHLLLRDGAVLLNSMITTCKQHF